MSTYLDIYPFREFYIYKAIDAIEYFFVKFTGLAQVKIRAVARYSSDPKIFFDLKLNELVTNKTNIKYAFLENIYSNTGADLLIMDADTISDDPVKFPNQLASVSDIRLRASASLILKMSVAFGVAKAMGNDYVYHMGDFCWLAEKRRESVYSKKNYESNFSIPGYEIPIEFIENMPNAIFHENLNQAVSDFFKNFDMEF